MEAVRGTALQGPEFRFDCYPVRSGRWSYATAYTSKTGAPIRSGDLYIDPAGRDTAKQSADTEAVWLYAHAIVSSNRSITVDRCTKNLNWIVAAVRRSPQARLTTSDYNCYEFGNKIYYQVNYLGSSSTAGVARDIARPQSVRVLDGLGYQVPGIDYNSTARR